MNTWQVISWLTQDEFSTSGKELLGEVQNWQKSDSMDGTKRAQEGSY
jgi:hypothetical protein